MVKEEEMVCKGR